MSDARRDAWLAERRTIVTASDVAAILGLGWQTMMDVFLDKIGEREVEQNERMRWGLRLQRVILEEYAERTGEAIEFADEYAVIRHPDYPFLGATLDARRAEGDRRPIDAKNVGFRSREWGESKTDEVPYAYALQLHVQMMVTGTQVADLAVLFSGHAFDYYTVHRDPEVESAIISAAADFYEKHIQTGIPPPVDASTGWHDFLQKRVRQRKSEMRPSTLEIDETIRRLLEVNAEIERLEVARRGYENSIKSEIGEYAGIESPIARVRWVQSKDWKKTEWEALATDLSTRWEVDTVSKLVDHHSHLMPGVRRFTISRGDK